MDHLAHIQTGCYDDNAVCVLLTDLLPLPTKQPLGGLTIWLLFVSCEKITKQKSL